MARKIDRDALYQEFEAMGWYDNADRDLAEDVLLRMPTLTPPNEPLTLEQLWESPHGKIKDSTLESICNRANEIASRPPEGEEDI